jgi:hypothetical protein
MLLWGKLLPETPIALKLIAPKFAGAVYAVPPLERAITTEGSGSPAFAGGGDPLPWTEWVCTGISESSSVIFCEPDISPRSCKERPGP